MKSKEIKKHIEEGYLRIRVLFEIIGTPKKHIEDTLKAYIENVKTHEGVIVLEEEFEEATEIKNQEEEKETVPMWGTLAEVEMLVDGIDKLTWLAINFSPASIELLEPDNLTMESKEVSNWITDVLARLHEIGVHQKTINNQNQGLIRNFNAMTRNAILLCLQDGEKDIDFLSKKIGMANEHTQKFLDALIKENKIKNEKNKYIIIK